MAAQFRHDRFIVPGAGADEMLHGLARAAGLVGDGLGGLAFQAAEAAADDQGGEFAQLAAVEEGQVALQEVGEVVVAGLDVFGPDGGVGEQGFGLGAVEQGHGTLPAGESRNLPPALILREIP